MHEMYKEEHTEAVLLVDAANPFNSVTRKVFLHNIKVVFLSLSTYVQTCYTLPSRLFIIGETETKSSDGTTQSDPIAIPIYAFISYTTHANGIRDNQYQTKFWRWNGSICWWFFSSRFNVEFKRLVGYIVRIRSKIWLIS